MSTLIESYKKIFDEIEKIYALIAEKKEEIKKRTTDVNENIQIRIGKLEEQLKRIEDYLPKIIQYQELAKDHLESQNVLTIEAPPGYRVNLNRLRTWSMMIDPMSSNDPYAQRVFLVAKCDEFFLKKKREEFEKRIEELKTEHTNCNNEEIEVLSDSIKHLEEDVDHILTSDDFKTFLEDVKAANNKSYHRSSPETYTDSEEIKDTISPGAYAAPISFDSTRGEKLKSILGDFYDERSGRILLPVEIDNKKEFVITVACSPSNRKKLDKALQNLMLSILESAPAGTRKIYIADGVRFNTSSISGIRGLEDTFVMEKIPKNPEQMTELLENIVSSFADTDDIIENYDSITEYNAEAEPGKKLPYTYIFLYGWPGAYEGRDRELIQRIMTGYERYGVSIITVSYAKTADELQKVSGSFMPEYAMQNAIHIDMMGKNLCITLTDGTPQFFSWYSFNDELSSSYTEALLKLEKATEKIGNEYTKRHSMTDVPVYQRNYKKLELPFGINGKDEEFSISFEYENFAAYLVGASRSGKSTLIHTLISGVIRNYHPDNVELWLADFKQLEFKPYIDHLPPHVKYVLLDESKELVCDLIDKLTDIMLDRQKYFSKMGVQRLDQLDPAALSNPMPVIFVILDEFSIMSQAIQEETDYKLKLQNILAKGAALGIKFLFASQKFTSGLAGLTSTAKDQIQQRIAMKGTLTEISETLELTASMRTEQVNNWMAALPPHYALIKYKTDKDTPPQVKRYMVMYFKDYKPRNDMIERLRQSMTAVEKYDPANISSYVDKHPVLVDGNSYYALDEKKFLENVQKNKEQWGDELLGDELFLSFGTPRLMESMKLSVLSSETRENILFIGRAEEQACSASVLFSAIRCVLIQGKKAELWVYEKNRLYRSYKGLFEKLGIKIVKGINEICNEIKALKANIQNKTYDEKMIFLVGMERICIDFEYVNGKANGHKKAALSSNIIEKQTTVETKQLTPEEKNRKDEYEEEWLFKKADLMDQPGFDEKSNDEKKAFLEEEELKFRKEKGVEDLFDVIKKEVPPDPVEKQAVAVTELPDACAYNAMEDLKLIIMQGSRLGFHFFMLLNVLDDLKVCGLKTDYFRHRLSFRLSKDDSTALFGKRAAYNLPEHVCQYDDGITIYSVRPYIHRGITWDGWETDENGRVIDPFKEKED